MDAETLRGHLEARFGSRVESVARSPRRLYARVPPPLLLEVVGMLQDLLPGFRLGTSTGIDLRSDVGVFHHFVVNGRPLVITLKLHAPKPEPLLPSLAQRFPSARWIEREMSEMLGVTFEGHPDPRPLLKARAFDPALRPLGRAFDVPAFKEEIGERLDW